LSTVSPLAEPIGCGGAAPRPIGSGSVIVYDYLHVAVDDHSRVAFVQVHPNELGQTTARFVLDAAAHFAELGVKIERVMTDRHLSYTNSGAFREALVQIGARHLVTAKYRPQTNGKAERFIQTMLREWAYRRLYTSNQQRLRARNRQVLWIGILDHAAS
jgi:transposase InsO family protein